MSEAVWGHGSKEHVGAYELRCKTVMDEAAQWEDAPAVFLTKYCPGDQMKQARYGERGDGYCVLVMQPERKKLLGRPKPRWKDYIKWILKKFVWREWTAVV
jgi:hypothetical protein